MSTPLVSICLPNLNHRRFLPERMESILSQTLQDWELIVCDSYSDDGSWEFFQTFKGDPRIHLHQVPRDGLYAGWNECLRRCRGRYVYIATSDDGMRSDALEKFVEPLELHPDVHIAVCDYEKVDQENRVLAKSKGPFDEFIASHCRTHCIRKSHTEFLMHACAVTIWFSMNSVLFRRTVLDQAGYFRVDQKSFADVEWTLRASLTSDVAVIPEKLVSWRKYTGQATPSIMWPDDVRILHQAVVNVLSDPNSGIPSAWKEKPGWDKKILRASRAIYLASYDLYRWSLRKNPRQFFRLFMEAAAKEPLFLLQRALTGFTAGAELNVDTVALVNELIREFGTEWPPKTLWKK